MTSFTPLEFWCLIPFVLAAYYAFPARMRPAFLALLSLIYYAAANWFYLPLLVGEILFTYGVGHRLARAGTDRVRMAWLLAGLVPVAGALVAFKLDDQITHGLLAPLGISYFTFKLVAYIVEIYWDERQTYLSLVDFTAFIAFAPQMMSGPIQRPADFRAQLPAVKTCVDLARIESGMFLILDGLLLKLVVGDRLGDFVVRIDAAPEHYRRMVVLATILAYLPRLYADFAGYTKIALGLGQLFGISGPPNFNAPFAARNVQDYWRRWHMSLTGWLTDYVFTPLRMQTRRWGSVSLVISIFTTMVLVGIWHRITATFFVYGLLQGALLTLSALSQRRRETFFTRHPRLMPLRRFGGPIGTYLLMTTTLTVWFAPSLAQAMAHFTVLVRHDTPDLMSFYHLPPNMREPTAAALVIAIYHGAGAPGYAWLRRHCWPWHMPRWVAFGIRLALLSAFAADQGGGFIYGQF